MVHRPKRMTSSNSTRVRARLVVPTTAALGVVLLALGAGEAAAQPMSQPTSGSAVGAAVTGAMTSGSMPAAAAQKDEQIRALIVRYERGYAPKGRVLGVTRVTGAQRTNLILGSALGGRMWRIDFKTPVDEATAQRVARQLASHPAVEFAELDRKVTAFR